MLMEMWLLTFNLSNFSTEKKLDKNIEQDFKINLNKIINLFNCFNYLTV